MSAWRRSKRKGHRTIPSRRSTVGEIGRRPPKRRRRGWSRRCGSTRCCSPIRRRSHVVVRGQTAGVVGAAGYAQWRTRLRDVVLDDLRRCAMSSMSSSSGRRLDSRINLRGSDMRQPRARLGSRPTVVVVSDIDRGGSLAHLFGTTAILDPDDQRLVRGYLSTKFRGDPGLLTPGLDRLEAERPAHPRGAAVWSRGSGSTGEDSLSVSIGARVGPATSWGQPARRRDPSPRASQHHRRGSAGQGPTSK